MTIRKDAKASIFPKDFWSHVFIWVLILFTLFPIYVVITSSFNPTGSLATSELWPKLWSLDNYKVLFTLESVPYLTWVKNSMIIASINVIP